MTTLKTALALVILASTQAFAGGFQGNGETTPTEKLYGKTLIELQQYLNADPAGILKAKKLGITNPKALRDQLLNGSLFPLAEGAFDKLGADPAADRALVVNDALLKMKASPEFADSAAKALGQIPEIRSNLSLREIEARYPISPAEVPMRAGDLVVNGTGCAQGLGVIAKVDARRGLIDLNFASLFADSFEKKLSRATCSLALPISIPVGKMLVIETLDTSAIVDTPEKAKATTNFEAFFAGTTGPRIAKVYAKTTAARDLVRSKINLASRCGEDVILRLNASALMQTPAGGLGILAIDRAILKVSLKACR